MKKIILPETLHNAVRKDRSFLDRRGFRVFTSRSNDEALVLHRSERADLIVADPTAQGLSTETLCESVRDDETLRRVSIIVVCPGDARDAERYARCGANALVPSPVNPTMFLEEAHRLLHVAMRTDYRVPVAVRLEGESAHRQFLGFTENVSASGMLFGSETDLGEGDMVTCSFHLPDLTNIRAVAEIVRVLQRRAEHDINLYGVNFTDPAAPSVEAIETFIREETQRPQPVKDAENDRGHEPEALPNGRPGPSSQRRRTECPFLSGETGSRCPGSGFQGVAPRLSAILLWQVRSCMKRLEALMQTGSTVSDAGNKGYGARRRGTVFC